MSNGCFFTGSSTSLVYGGKLQSPGLLAMRVNVYDEKGKPVVGREGGLVCEAPSLSIV